ncbi:hypothetical protein AYI68_g8322 [Smittium mucronatum]|uniref:Uncharacterized protein n=1 Tax=Smittium mucronatum TaxID=133383 RepID=A0A1R0GL82_9FUNG|nr:hypothetical protein AYI68_g8322 [Smittium mucronatum]
MQYTNRKTPPPEIGSSRCITEVTRSQELIPLSTNNYVSAVLNDRSLLFRDGPSLEFMSSESLCAVFTTPNQEYTTLCEILDKCTLKSTLSIS